VFDHFYIVLIIFLAFTTIYPNDSGELSPAKFGSNNWGNLAFLGLPKIFGPGYANFRWKEF